MFSRFLWLVTIAVSLGTALGEGPANVLVVVNEASPQSRNIGEYYARRRGIPLKNICRIRASTSEEIQRAEYNRTIAAPVATCLRRNGLVEQVLYIVTTGGVPLRVAGSLGQDAEIAAVDSELAVLYGDMKTGQPHKTKGRVPNPFFSKKTAKFTHPEFPMYMVTRLAAYDFNTVRAMIDRSMAAKNTGKFVLDMRQGGDESANSWLLNASLLLPKERVVLERSGKVLYGETGVLGYASWGSNDRARNQRFTNFKWLPGAVATEFVSTDGRTFQRPPKDWNISDWQSSKLWWAGSPQTLTADFLEEGATAATGHVEEPYLNATPRPDILFPAYFSGRNLAESYYLSIPYLSWQNILVGDPLCTLGPP